MYVVNSPNEDETMMLTPEKSKAEAKKEIHNYLCLDVAVGNPVTWWKQNEKHFPVLSQKVSLRACYLCAHRKSLQYCGIHCK